MPRPADQTIGSGPGGGFGPTAGASENLGQIDVSTIHQLDVDGSTAGAKALAAVFSKPLTMASKAADERYAAQQEADTKQGQLDALNGNVDPDKNQNGIFGMASNYANGVKMAQTQMKGYEAAEKAKQLFAQNPGMSLMDTTDENGNKVPGLHSQIDNLFANAFPGGQEKDPTIANVLMPIMQHTLNEITSAAYQHKIQTDQQTAEDSTQAGVMHAIQFNTPISMSMELDKLTKVYGANARQGREALVHAVGEAAASTGSPDAINKYLPPGIDFGGGATLTPENQQYLDQARNRATENQNRNNQAGAKVAANNIADTMITGKDPTALLHDYLKMPGASATEALDMSNWYYRRSKEKETDSVDNNAATWDMDRKIATGDITNGGQVISFLTDHNIGNTKAGNQLLQRGMNNIRAFQNTNADDPDYKAGAAFIAQNYNPARDPLTQKFVHDSANSQQAGAMLDYRTLYNQFIKVPNTSSTDAARKAQKSVLDKWGDSVEDPTGQLRSKGPFVAPKSESEQAEIVRNAGSNLAAFHAAGIRSQDIDVLRSSGMVGDADAARAYQIIVNKLQPK